MPNADPQIIFDAKTQRFGGLFSQANATTLPAGFYSVAKNWRFDEALPRGRWGMGKINNATLATGHTVGTWSGTLNGQPYQIWAQYVDSISEIVLYKHTSFSTLDEITVTTGSFKYQDTRIAYSSPGTAGNPIHMAAVKDRSNGKEYLIIGCGEDYARVWDPTVSTSGSSVAINQPMSTTPEKTPLRQALVTFPKFYPLYDAASQSYTNLDGVDFFLDDVGTSSTTNYVVLRATSSAAVDDTADFNFVSAVDLSACRQIIFYYESTWTSIWEKVGVTLGENATYTDRAVWDPSASPRTNAPIIIPADTSGKRWYAVFSLDHIASANRDAVDDIRLTFERGTLSSTQTVNFFGIFGSGKILGQAFHALSYFNEGSRAESPGIWFNPEHYVGEGLRNLGVRASDESTLPNDPRVYYDYKLFVPNPVTADLEAGWDRIRIYRSDVGEQPLERTLVTAYTVGSYAAGWTFASGSSGSLLTLTDNTAVGSKNTSIPAPDYNTLTIPKSSALLYETGRLFAISYAASAPTGVTTSPSTLWASDLNHFSRFRYFHQSEDQGTTCQLANEIGHELKSMPTAMRGVPACYLWTNESLYRFSPTTGTQINQLERVAPYGTLTKFSIATSQDSVYWLDQARIVRRMSPRGIEDISSFAVKDKLDQIGGAAFYLLGLYGGWFLAFGAFHNEKYYLSFDRDGSTSASSNIEEPLVFDERLGVWVEDDLGGTTTYSARFPTSFRGKLFVASIDRRIYEYEQSGALTDGYDSQNPTPGGTAFDLTLETGYLQPSMDGGFVVESMKVMCDGMTGLAGTGTATYLPDGSAPTFTLDLDDASSVIWSHSTKASPVSGKGHGVSAKLKIVFSASAGTGGMRLYKWGAMVSPRSVEATNYN